MDEELDPEVIKATQLSLGKYIKRPPLSEKLLKKPPFRFLHDIITTVLKTTGFFEGLFDENELISDNVKDRDSKISFLNKAILIISVTTGKKLSVKPSKIVAGQEPTKTNEFLQCLASALDNNLSSHEAVKKYKENVKIQGREDLEVTSNKDPDKPQKKTHDSKKGLLKNENTTSQKKEGSELSVTKKDKEKANDKTRKKESGVVKIESRNKNTRSKLLPKKVTSDSKLQPQSKTHLNETKSNVASDHREPTNFTQNGNIPSSVDERSVTNTITDTKLDVVKLNTDGKEEIIDTALQINLKSAQPESITEIEIKNNETSVENTNSAIIEANEQYENMIHTSRKSSLVTNEKESQNSQINKFETKSNVKELESLNNEPESNKNTLLSTPIKNESNARPVSVRPSSSRPGAPRPKDKFENLVSDTDSNLLGKVNIIVEHAQNEEEEDSSIIIMDEQESSTTASKDKQEELTFSANEHGHLVQQILDSQKEFSQVTGKTEIEWQFGAQKAKATQHQEIELLRYNIQALTRVTNPLGKLLDHIQEDVEVMRQEVQQWSNIFEEVSKEIQKQKTLNEDSLLPLLTKRKQLDLDIQEKTEKINDLKVLIYKNSSRIEKLLANNNVQ